MPVPAGLVHPFTPTCRSACIKLDLRSLIAVPRYPSVSLSFCRIAPLSTCLTTFSTPSSSLSRVIPSTMASRSLPKLVQSTAARRVAASASSAPQQRALSSLRQAAAGAFNSASSSSSSSVRKTALQAAGSVTARRYAHSGEKSEYMVSLLNSYRWGCALRIVGCVQWQCADDMGKASSDSTPSHHALRA